RLRYTGAASLMPDEVAPRTGGIVLGFDVPLDRTLAGDPSRYSAARWNYRRTYRYGSAQYRPDGAIGQEPLEVTAAQVSRDGRKVFLQIPRLATGVMQVRVEWNLASARGEAMSSNTFFSPYSLPTLDAAAEGFDPIHWSAS